MKRRNKRRCRDVAVIMAFILLLGLFVWASGQALKNLEMAETGLSAVSELMK